MQLTVLPWRGSCSVAVRKSESVDEVDGLLSGINKQSRPRSICKDKYQVPAFWYNTYGLLDMLRGKLERTHCMSWQQLE